MPQALTELSNLFKSGDYSLWDRGLQNVNQEQAATLADIASKQGIEQRAAQMQPLEMAHRQALTRQGNANAATVEDALTAQAPVKDRVALKVKENFSKMSDLDRANTDAQMYELGNWLGVAKANNGTIPLPLQGMVPEHIRTMFAQPEGMKNALAWFKAYHENHPKTIEARQKQAYELEKARIMAGPGYARAAAVSQGKGATAKLPKSSRELMTYYTMKANEAATEEEAADWNAKAEAEWQKLQQEILLKAAAGQSGKVDVGAAANIPVNPTATPVALPTARPGTPRPPKPGSSPDNPIVLK